MCRPLLLASAAMRARDREWMMAGLRMTNPSFTSLRTFCPEQWQSSNLSGCMLRKMYILDFCTKKDKRKYANFYICLHQEGVGTFGRHMSNRLNFIYSEFLSSRAIDWYIYESNPGGVGVGVVPRCGYSFFGGSPIFFLGHSHGVLNISLESSAQAQSIGTLFE